jgi:hypothetical protein
MHCLYCNRRLWLYFFTKRQFCSKRHEVAYHDEMAAINRLMELTVRTEPLAIPERASTIAPTVFVPALCNLIVERGHLKRAFRAATNAVLLEAAPFVGRIQYPSRSGGVAAFTLDSTTEPVAEFATKAPEPSRRTSKSSPAKSRTKRRKPR